MLNIDANMQEAFRQIISYEKLSPPVLEIAESVLEGKLTSETIEDILSRHHLHSVQDIKKEMLDLILMYARLAFRINGINDKEIRNIEILRACLKTG